MRISSSSSSSSKTTAVAIAIPVVVGVVLIALLFKRWSRRRSVTAGGENDPESLPKNSDCPGVHSPQNGTNGFITSPPQSNSHRNGLEPQSPPRAYRGQQHHARDASSNPVDNSWGGGKDYRWSGEERREVFLLSQNPVVNFPVAAPAVFPASSGTQMATTEPLGNRDDSEPQVLRERLQTLEAAFSSRPPSLPRLTDTPDRPPAYESRPGSPRVSQGRIAGEGT